MPIYENNNSIAFKIQSRCKLRNRTPLVIYRVHSCGGPDQLIVMKGLCRLLEVPHTSSHGMPALDTRFFISRVVLTPHHHQQEAHKTMLSGESFILCPVSNA
jgi:hypothetical protein